MQKQIYDDSENVNSRLFIDLKTCKKFERNNFRIFLQTDHKFNTINLKNHKHLSKHKIKGGMNFET